MEMINNSFIPVPGVLVMDKFGNPAEVPAGGKWRLMLTFPAMEGQRAFPAIGYSCSPDGQAEVVRKRVTYVCMVACS